MSWNFYGRQTELKQLSSILSRNRWFFAKITGRRRIGKTALVKEALAVTRQAFYVQIPDSSPSGVLSAAADALETFQLSSQFKPPKSLLEFAKLISQLIRAGFVVTLDEFQYFNRKKLFEFCSFLQHEVDSLASEKVPISGGLLVLGSIQTEMAALLEDRHAPLYNRVTDEIELQHLEINSICEILKANQAFDPNRLLFLWSLFEGVPKFYRDCYEQNSLSATRSEVLERLFFQSSSPLKSEAENWFLKELHGRYDTILKYIAKHPGCTHADLVAHSMDEEIGGHLKVLMSKYLIIERKMPLFASNKSRNGRYYIRDNFLRSWLGALAPAVAALPISPLPQLIKQADTKLQILEGFAFEKLVGQLYEERSRLGIGNFALTSRIEAYWDRAGTEIDLVALSEGEKRIRFGNCKRSANKLLESTAVFEGHIERFLKEFPIYSNWKIEKVGLSPVVPPDIKEGLKKQGMLSEDLADLLF